jgi:hypothetical protein
MAHAPMPSIVFVVGIPRSVQACFFRASTPQKAEKSFCGFALVFAGVHKHRLCVLD